LRATKGASFMICQKLDFKPKDGSTSYLHHSANNMTVLYRPLYRRMEITSNSADVIKNNYVIKAYIGLTFFKKLIFLHWKSVRKVCQDKKT
jgi:hypothetical protein